MKYWIIITFWIVFINTVLAQENYKEIPQKVLTRFTQLYPGVNMAGIDWDKEKNNYEANFIEEGKRNSATFDSQGNWLLSEQKDVTLQELPKNIINGLYFSQYSDWQTDDIHVMMNSHDMLYEIEVKKGLRDEKIYFDKTGTLTDRKKL